MKKISGALVKGMFSCGYSKYQLLPRFANEETVKSLLSVLVTRAPGLDKNIWDAGMHPWETCVKQGHDTEALNNWMNEGLDTDQTIMSRVPVVAIQTAAAVTMLVKKLYTAEIRFVPNKARFPFYELELECERALPAGIEVNYLQFGSFGTGMSTLDIYEMLMDYIQFNTAQHPECSSSHDRFTSAEQYTYELLKKSPVQFAVLLTANGGLCPLCMVKLKEIYRDTHEALESTPPRKTSFWTAPTGTPVSPPPPPPPPPSGIVMGHGSAKTVTWKAVGESDIMSDIKTITSTRDTTGGSTWGAETIKTVTNHSFGSAIDLKAPPSPEVLVWPGHSILKNGNRSKLKLFSQKGWDQPRLCLFLPEMKLLVTLKISPMLTLQTNNSEIQIYTKLKDQLAHESLWAPQGVTIKPWEKMIDTLKTSFLKQILAKKLKLLLMELPTISVPTPLVVILKGIETENMKDLRWIQLIHGENFQTSIDEALKQESDSKD